MPQGGRNGSESLFTQELAAEICNRLAAGESLLSISKTEGYPSETAIRFWALEDREGFASKYARARDIGLDCRADQVMQKASGVAVEDVPSARLEFDAARWYLSKLAPKRYGDAILQKHAGADGETLKVQVEEIKGNTE